MSIMIKSKLLVKKSSVKSKGESNVKFLQALCGLFRDDKTNGAHFDYGKLQRLKGYPDGADIENAEFLGLDGDKAWFTVFGDWQDEVNFAVTLRNGKLVITNKFDANAPEYNYSRITNDIKTVAAAGGFEKSFGETTVDWDSITKALTHKYIRRWPDPKNPKKWRYLYTSDFIKRPIEALIEAFRFKKEKIDDDYAKNNIKEEYGADKKTFAMHILEYFAYKVKWDKFFGDRKNRETYKKPQKAQIEAAKKPDKKTVASKTGKIDSKKGSGYTLNRSLMRKVWGIYNKQEDKEDERTDRQNNAGTGMGSIPQSTGPVQPGKDKGNSNQYGAETVQGTPDNQGDATQLLGEFGKRSGRGIRLTKNETKNIREECISLLNSKIDDEITEEGKDLLRQYEGAGGLGEEGASTHGTLYEYYTPRNVVKKVWQLVDKYIPGAKNVLEPSAGIGRFAEDRPNDKFTLNEFDPTSSRISHILNPQAECPTMAFQEMFKPGKAYTGQKYDVVIGNPPYGKYEGLWKGKGEGVEHNRYEEYFIDRGLDTLREGGIMAFVVPSSFLRDKDSKIKQKIAAKGKLMEAWRLPNGTFNTTGVGTDIIIIRKEKGDPAQFSNNAYFEKNPSMVMGIETTRTGRFGKDEQYVGLPAGETFDEAIDRINADTVEATPLGVPTEKERLEKKVNVIVEEDKKGKISKKDHNKIMQNNYQIGQLKTTIQQQEYILEDTREETEQAREDLRRTGDPIEQHPMTGALIRREEEIIEYVDRLKAQVEELEKENRELEKPKGRSRSEAMMGNDNAKKLFFELLNTTLRTALTHDDVNEYETLDGGIGYFVTVRSKAAAQRTKERWEKNGGYASFDPNTNRLDLSTTPLLGQSKSSITPMNRLAEKYKLPDKVSREFFEIACESDGTEDFKKKAKEYADELLVSVRTGKRTFRFPKNFDYSGFKQDSLDIFYDGDLKTPEPEKSEGEKHKNRSEAMKGNDNAAGSHDVDTAEEFNKKYNKKIAPEAMPIWKATNLDGTINVNKLQNTKYLETSGNYVKTADGEWYDIVNFASGNIYDKLDGLERDRELLSKSEYERQKSILLKVLPKPQTVTEFEVSPLSYLAENFITSEVDNGDFQKRNYARNRNSIDTDDHTGEPLNLNRAFIQWLRNADSDGLALRVRKDDIIAYINKESVRAERGRTEEQKEANRIEAQRLKTNRREDTERLFNQFIRERLSIEDQKRLEDAYNRQTNGIVQADYTKIPLFLDGISKTFKGDEFKLNDSQLKTLSWYVANGNGIAALDVGVGKTIVGICAAVIDIQMGRCKKPIIPVPKAVYENWKKEIADLFPNLKVNDLGNFSDIGKWKDEDGKLKIEEGSLSICTYEALEKIGFDDLTLETELKSIFVEALTAEAEGASDRKKKQEEESIMTKVGKAARVGDNWVNWEDTGFDHITVDEAHNFRNSFSKPKNKKKGDAAEFDDIPGGSTALRGLKLFAISQMIQKHNNGRNVHLLSATPFQNSPVEIYNILSLVARQELQRMGIINFNEMLVQFAELKPEISVDSKNNMVQKNVMKGFKNLPALQNLLNRYCMKIDGEDAGIIRPDRKDHQVYLDMTAEQRDITEKIRAYMEAGPSAEKDPGATLRCLNALRQAALSPMLVEGFEFLDPMAAGKAGIHERKIRISKKDFVKDSPKMKFVTDTVTEFYKKHPDKGQIIHLPQGIEHYEAVKKYLVSKGVPEDAIVFMAPAPEGKKAPPYLRPGDKGNDQKEEYKAMFNDPKNKVKIIIGSDTIKEGVNLNGNTVNTYPCMLDWNPTGTQQLIGRSWRQGNEQGKVHIVFPLVNDSVDSFMYQKHDEKKSRLDALWKSKDKKMEIDEVSPEELKFMLIKDPKKRADLYIREKTAELVQKQKIAEATSDKIFKMSGERAELIEAISDNEKDIVKMRDAISAFNKKTDAQIIEEFELDFNSSYSRSIYDDFGAANGKNIKELRENYIKAVKENISNSQRALNRSKGRIETIDNTLQRYDIDKPGNDAIVERARKRYSNEAMLYKTEIAAIEKNREKYIKDAEKQIKAEARPGMPTGEAVDMTIRAVTGDMYSMQVVKDRVKAAQETATEGVKKSVVLLLPKKIKVRVKG